MSIMVLIQLFPHISVQILLNTKKSFIYINMNAIRHHEFKKDNSHVLLLSTKEMTELFTQLRIRLNYGNSYIIGMLFVNFTKKFATSKVVLIIYLVLMNISKQILSNISKRKPTQNLILQVRISINELALPEVYLVLNQVVQVNNH